MYTTNIRMGVGWRVKCCFDRNTHGLENFVEPYCLQVILNLLSFVRFVFYMFFQIKPHPTREFCFAHASTFSEDTAFLENVDELQRYFGVTFRDNPLVSSQHRMQAVKYKVFV